MDSSIYYDRRDKVDVSTARRFPEIHTLPGFWRPRAVSLSEGGLNRTSSNITLLVSFTLLRLALGGPPSLSSWSYTVARYEGSTPFLPFPSPSHLYIFSWFMPLFSSQVRSMEELTRLFSPSRRQTYPL